MRGRERHRYRCRRRRRDTPCCLSCSAVCTWFCRWWPEVGTLACYWNLPQKPEKTGVKEHENTKNEKKTAHMDKKRKKASILKGKTDIFAQSPRFSHLVCTTSECMPFHSFPLSSSLLSPPHFFRFFSSICPALPPTHSPYSRSGVVA